MNITIIGMGVMGSNLALNFASKGFEVFIYNRTAEHTLSFYEKNKKEYGKKLKPVTGDLKNLVSSVGKGIYFIMIKAGEPTINTANSLFEIVPKGSIVVDLANSRFQDTIMLEKKSKEKNVLFFGAGVSGGEDGARLGPSIMVGGADKKSYETYLKKPLEKVAAIHEKKPCVAYLGNHGAGHFVKMVHNGIEYADMQLISEVYDLLRNSMSADEIAEVFETWNKGKLNSFLIEITSKVLRQKNTSGKGNLVDFILDKAGMKGTGTWTVQNSLDLSNVVSIPTIYSAVSSRAISYELEKRKKLAKEFQLEKSRLKVDLEILEDALYVAKIAAYAQGIELIKKGYSEFGFGTADISEIAKIWRAGCIIRAKFLDDISKNYKPSQETLLQTFKKDVFFGFSALQRACFLGIETNTPMPGFDSSRNYILQLTAEKSPANLLQGQRDFFGAHTYERNDKEGVFHTDWHNGLEERQ